MKKYLLRALCILPFASQLNANDTTGHTFFSVQPQFHAVLPTKTSLIYDTVEAKQDGICAALQMVPFGSISQKPEELTTFFFPFGLKALIAGEFNSSAVKNNTVAIMANYFGVLTRPISEVYGTGTLEIDDLTFQSLVRFNPKQSTMGIGLTYKQKITDFHDPDKGWWIQISSPLMEVTNDLGFTETVINPGGGEVPEGFVGTIGDALRGDTVFGSKHFEYGKISDCPLKRWGLADIELFIGRDNNVCKDFLRMWYFGAVIPSGNKPKGEYIFEPIVGNNKHWGLVLGGEYSYPLWTNCNGDKSIIFHTIAHSQILFSNIQRRSFDLIDKQWSRYIWMYENQQAVADILNITPGINLLTLPCKVWPRTSSNTNVSFEFLVDCGFIAEAGYSTYYRQAEEVELCCPFGPGPIIAGINPENTKKFVSESQASMRAFLPFQGVVYDQEPYAFPAPTDPTPNLVFIQDSDIDLRSAAMPCVVSHILWATIGYNCSAFKHPLIAALGGAYEYSPDNNALHRLTIWAKFSVSL